MPISCKRINLSNHGSTNTVRIRQNEYQFMIRRITDEKHNSERIRRCTSKIRETKDGLGQRKILLTFGKKIIDTDEIRVGNFAIKDEKKWDEFNRKFRKLFGFRELKRKFYQIKMNFEQICNQDARERTIFKKLCKETFQKKRL